MMAGDFRLSATVGRPRGGSVALGGVAGYAFEGVAEGAFGGVAELRHHECIRTRYPSGALYRWEFERRGKALRIDVPGSLTLDEPSMIAQASRAGIGLAYVGESIVADDIASGRLVEVLSEWTPSYPGYCLYYPGRRHMAASLRAFIDLAQKMVSRNRAKAS